MRVNYLSSEAKKKTVWLCRKVLTYFDVLTYWRVKTIIEGRKSRIHSHVMSHTPFYSLPAAEGIPGARDKV